MMRALYTSTTGMRQHEIGLDVISNNLANVSTTGFKRSQVQFSDLLYQTSHLADARTNSLQVGLGAGTAAISPLFTQGAMQTTSNKLDMMIEGNGFFIVKRRADGAAATPTNGGLRYTRAGHFMFDAGRVDSPEAYVIDPVTMNYTVPVRLVDASTGYIVQGWLADPLTGVIAPTLNQAGDIEFDSGIKAMAAAATANIRLGGTLQSDAALKYTTVGNPADAVLTRQYGHPTAGGPGIYTITSYADGSADVQFEEAERITRLDNEVLGVTISGSATAAIGAAYTIAAAVDPAPEAGTLLIDMQTVNNYGQITTTTRRVDLNATDTSLIPGVAVTFGSALNGPVTISDRGETTTTHAYETTTVLAGTSVVVVEGTATGDSAGRNGEYRLTISGGMGSVDFVDALTGTVTPVTPGGVPVAVAAGANDGTLIPGLSVTLNNIADGTARLLHTVPLQAGMTNHTLIPGVALTPGAVLANGTTVIDTTGAVNDGMQAVNTTIFNSDGETQRLSLAFTRSGENRWEYSARLDASEEWIATAPLAAGAPVITLPATPEANGVRVTVNGRELAGTEYAVRGADIVQVDLDGDGISDSPALAAGDVVRVDYSVVPVVDGAGARTGAIGFDADGLMLTGLTDIDSGLPPATFTSAPEFNLTFGTSSVAIDLYHPVFDPADPARVLDTATRQFAGDSELGIEDIDGNAAGTLLDFSVDAAGRIVGQYSNGVNRDLAQVALAFFDNPQGLQKTGDNYFTATDNSGVPLTRAVFRAAVMGDAGAAIQYSSIRGSALEASNVDMATEMIDMLAFQRAYQLNSRGITTASDMIKTAVDMKR